MKLVARQALLPDGWANAVEISIEAGRIAGITTGSTVPPSIDTLLPGGANLHSHAFQRSFAGLTEARGPGADSFWTWREMMYRFALSLDPEQAQIVAEMAYIEMLEAGYTRLGEFHYLHHAPDGRAYEDPAEMSARIFAAAQETGIALTHLPVFYAHGGFGPKPAGEGQRRFLHDREGFLRLIEACDGLAAQMPSARVGFAPHSLRAASPEDLAALAEALPGRPLHIHIAEQMPEVTACLDWCGQRPVEWLLDHAELGPDWCLIHATHLTEAETQRLAASGAVAGLCPVTEANLGDGIFPGASFIAAGGGFGIGTDSNVRISLAEELRLLEYSQRLAGQARNVMAGQEGSTGQQLFTAAWAGGHQALGSEAVGLAKGAAADLVALHDPLELGSDAPTLLDRWIFGPDITVSDVWAGGAHLVAEGRHHKRPEISARFAAVVRDVLS
ncbi:MAG: formimidoylglutamate deiminase [Mangrovicoccus sp.]